MGCRMSGDTMGFGQLLKEREREKDRLREIGRESV